MTEDSLRDPAKAERFYKLIITVLCSIFCIIEVMNFIPLKWNGQVLLRPMPGMMFLAIHFALGFGLTFLVYNYKGQALMSRAGRYFDLACALAALVIGFYIASDLDAFLMRIGTAANRTDLIMAAAALFLVLEAARRLCGATLPLIAVITIVYALVGKYLPGILSHKGYTVSRILRTTFSELGIFGMPLNVSATTVFLFILFAAFLNVCGADLIFRNVSLALAGRTRGGPAKISILGSGLFGSISGSAVANVVGTGAFTIPLMKSQGYRPKFAGAVEAVASTGGQIMPPVMGAAAFILADFTGVPYGTVCLMAAIPALLYYVCVFIMVDIESIRNNMRGLDESQIPKAREVLARSAKLFIPIAVLLGAMIGFKKTPMVSAIAAMGTLIVCAMLDRRDRFTLGHLIQAFRQGAIGALQVIAACACSGIVIGMLNMTGLGLKFSTFIMALGGQSLLLCLLFAMAVSIILGMGLPTTAAYIITATSMGGSLVKLGLPIFPAHLFLFYFACISAITPPVAVASYAAAGLAKESPSKVGWEAVRLGIVGFLVPFAFALNPSLLSLELTNLPTLLNLVCTCIAPLAMAYVVQGYSYEPIIWPVRLLLAVAAVAMVSPWLSANLAGAAFTLFIARLYKSRAKARGHFDYLSKPGSLAAAN